MNTWLSSAVAGCAGVVAALFLLPYLMDVFVVFWPEASGLLVLATLVIVPGFVGGSVVAGVTAMLRGPDCGGKGPSGP